jgi:hypothetical protein
MNDTQQKPTREELLEKLRNKKKQNELVRMTKKNKDVVLEKLQSKAKSEQEAMMQEREKMMQELKKYTPEQLKQIGLDDKMIEHILSKNAESLNVQDEKQHEKQHECQNCDNMFNIPNVSLSKLSPVNKGNLSEI